MCVCMDGPARVSVMYLYMILHTYIKFRYPPTLRETSSKVTFFAASAMTHKGLSRSSIFAIKT